MNVMSEEIKTDCPEIGDKHGRFVVIGNGESKGGKKYLKVKCSCGTIKDVLKWNLTSGHIVSCGCAAREAQRKYFRTGTKKDPVKI